MSAAPPPAEDAQAPDRATFRLPWVSLLFPLLLFYCATPLATWRPWMLWLYLIPLGALVYVAITRTQVDRHRVRTVSLLGARTVAWDQLDGFEFRGPRWAVAVTTDGRRIRLPMVRPRDMPVVAQVSGGWITLSRPPSPGADDPESTPVGPPEPDAAVASGAGAPAEPETEPGRAVPAAAEPAEAPDRG